MTRINKPLLGDDHTATGAAPSVTDMPLSVLEEVLDNFHSRLAAVLPDGYVLAGGEVRRVREGLPDRITVDGMSGPVDIGGIPYIAEVDN